jgi:hypothetical protein
MDSMALERAKAKLSLSLLSLSCNNVAVPSITVQARKLLVTLNLVSKLVNTMKFNGIRYKLYIAALDDSGTMELLSVPIVGKYIPTVISKMFIAIKVKVSSDENAMSAMAVEAAAKRTKAKVSNLTFFSIAIEKVDEPYMYVIRKVEVAVVSNDDHGKYFTTKWEDIDEEEARVITYRHAANHEGGKN